ncbi:TPA: AlpA family phage regulatory protein [Vibrio parahaemolyticus]|nr:AlpA family phage regulatory protein [Vibrio parahaemolyticus]EJS2611966.1 AlpA family phage regulatory protein [Vibrio alginolyticus]ELA7821125.1 AlpA family phage regulatory protein [Vibrio alginolyticus]EMC8464529.1 AlpA family phage regulatory protein [Vibrio alginolyticus]EME3938354.1 AlpA family phage regulatory protein [Vibrio alginolyticus]
MNTQSKVRLFIRTNELSEALGISLSTLWRWRKKGIVPEPLSLGPRVVGWRMKDINSWLENQ